MNKPRVARPGRDCRTSRRVLAGCWLCQLLWRGPQSQGTAARHTDATGHETWVDVAMSIRYTRGK